MDQNLKFRYGRVVRQGENIVFKQAGTKSVIRYDACLLTWSLFLFFLIPECHIHFSCTHSAFSFNEQLHHNLTNKVCNKERNE